VIGPDPKARTGDTRIDLANCAVFKVRGARPHRRPVSQNSTACVRVPGADPEKRALRPRSVDMLGGPDVHADAGTTPRRSSLERRCSSRSFRYGYLVTTSPQSRAPPSTAPSPKGLGHRLRVLPAFVV